MKKVRIDIELTPEDENIFHFWIRELTYTPSGEPLINNLNSISESICIFEEKPEGIADPPLFHMTMEDAKRLMFYLKKAGVELTGNEF